VTVTARLLKVWIDLGKAVVQLERQDLLAIHDGQCCSFICHRGVLWVTQERDVQDIIVAAPETFTIRRRGVTLITAVETSAISFLTAMTGHKQRNRLWRVLRSLTYGRSRCG
jgi:hypothetical protein